MGGMANVYKAFDVIDQRTVAVKILREEFLGNTEFLRRFKNESKAIAVLSHPNIVRVFDVSFTNRVHSIVMEYIDGITLKDYIERQGALTWKEAIHFTLQILRALAHAHDKGIVHRDIKPHNIMLLQNGTIKVTDFGIARFARSEVKTITDRAIGSVHYISPEQAMGDNTDEKTDIYSVGVMLFEMLTGRLPFEADSAVSVAIKQIQTQAVRPTSINPSIPEGLEDITLRAMQKDTARRYQSATAMIADIEKFKEDPSIHFQYKYLDNESPAAKNKKLRRAITETREDDNMPRRRKTPYIPILTGVTLAFVLASAGFIYLMVSLNNPFEKTKDIPVPTLIGLKYETAVEQNRDVDIVVEAEEFNDTHAKGVIFEQRPKPDSPAIKEYSEVKVKISKGKQQIILEDFTGQNADQVIQKLKEDGLEPKEQRENHDSIPSGYVIYTDPSKGMEVTSRTPVTVYVSIGPKETLVEIPSDIIGMTVQQANQFLEFSKLSIGNVSQEVSDMPEGTIIATDPAVGDLQPENTVINVIVSKGGSSVTLNIPVPDLGEPLSMRVKDLDNRLLASADLEPSDNTWKPEITGEKGDRFTVRVYVTSESGAVTGRRLCNYEIDFTGDTPTAELVDERFDAAEFNP